MTLSVMWEDSMTLSVMQEVKRMTLSVMQEDIRTLSVMQEDSNLLPPAAGVSRRSHF